MTNKLLPRRGNTLPRILQGRQNLRPFEYPLFQEAYDKSLMTHWSHHKIAMSADLLDWEQATEAERKIIGGILKGFTLIEIIIGCYWRDIVAANFLHPEIIAMAATFSATECIHVSAYDRLETTLGLDSYIAFTQDPIASKKLGDIVNRLDNAKNLALSLSIFSGACEGVSLFSSFAVLLSFTKNNKFKGMAAILSYSANEEMLHSKMGIQLYKQLIKEDPSLEPAEFEVVEGFNLVVENEISFLEDVFKDGDLDTITKSAAIDFVYYRANMKLMELDFKPLYILSGDYKEVKFFFDTLTKGKVMNDFFVTNNNGTAYTSTVSQDFTNINY